MHTFASSLRLRAGRLRLKTSYLLLGIISSVGDEPKTVSESTVSKTKLSDFFLPSLTSGRELSEFRWACTLGGKANSPSLSQNSPSSPQNSVSSLFRNSTRRNSFPSVSMPLRFQELFAKMQRSLRGPRSSYQRVVQGKCPLHFLI